MYRKHYSEENIKEIIQKTTSNKVVINLAKEYALQEKTLNKQWK